MTNALTFIAAIGSALVGGIFFAFSTSRAGTITVAPAPASVFVVSSPMPELPPVTIAIFPRRSMPLITSAAVDDALNPEPTGICRALP